MTIKTAEGVRLWELFDWQRDFVQLVLDNPRIPITLLSSRQTGKTIDLLGLAVYLCLSREQFSVLFVHRKLDDARHLARRFKRLIPHDIKLVADNLSLVEFENGSIAHFRGSGHKVEDGAEQAGRGLESVDLCVIEEASHTYNVPDLLGVIGPTMTHSPMATVIMVGTSGRRETYFYESLVGAYGTEQVFENSLEAIRQDAAEPYQVQRSADRIAVITNWRAIPEFAAEGKDQDGYPNYLTRIAKEQDLTQSQIDSEHELKFGSEQTISIFDFGLVKAAQRGKFEESNGGCVYYAGVDGSGKPRQGRKGDYTVCLVLKKVGDTFCVVHLYRQRGIPFERRYAEIAAILNRYRPRQTYVEANCGLGQTYEENLVTRCPSLSIERWSQSYTRKELLINKIELGLERREIAIPESPLIDELKSFVRFADGSAGAIGKGAHDDTVMALGMALAAASVEPQSKSSMPLIPVAKKL